MKLIDILVEELPKRGGWPEGVSKISSTSCGRVFFDGQSPHGFTLPVASDAWDSHKHPFSYTNAVTREQYEAALAAKNDGWIDWPGGKCPVEKGALIDVKWRDGKVDAAIPAKMRCPSRERQAIIWHHGGHELDIIAYRPHQPNEAEKVRAAAWNAYAGITRADDEADLNECIGQDAAPVWSGEGHPPVGVECEYSWAGEPWDSGVIRYISKHTIIIETQGDSTGDTECAYHPTDIKLRPLRTEADRKRDDICDKIYGAMTNAKRKDNHSDMAEEIYDAIAAGKIPGVKLED